MGMRTEDDLAQLDGIPAGQLHHGVLPQPTTGSYLPEETKKRESERGGQELYAKEFQYTQGVTNSSII